ncbi:MAG: glycosyltransferase family 4 protein [Pseudomonadota bacterium]
MADGAAVADTITGRILLVGPSLQDQGGVANYYNAVYPRLGMPGLDIDYLQIGSTHGRRSGFHVLADQYRFWRKLGSFRPDIVHLNPSLDLKSFLRDGLFVLLAKLRRKPVLVFFRGWQEPFERQVEGRFRRFFRITYLRADRFIVLASAFARKLRDWGVAAPIVLGTTAVADDMLQDLSAAAKAEQLLAAGPVRLLYLARLEPDKGVLELIDAVVSLLQGGADITLTIAGDGAAMEQVRARVAAHDRFHDRLRIAGYVRGEQKAEVLRSHHVYCFPTQYGEGMPNSVLEAMAFGMPVITCPVGGISDFFEDGRMGALLDGNRPATVARAIAAVIADRSRLADMSRYNHNYARAHFLASGAAAMLRQQYRAMLATATSVCSA